ncbi:MAG: Gfo/Idh/MocA family oxidoreductase [Acidobacteria bacterium]|nr:Gfo/Idh/MocA family oxidoreductase [Acidobacteriota bacterium]
MTTNQTKAGGLRFAVIGVGFWAQFQIGAWKELPGARLVALCDRDFAKARAAAERFGVPKVYGDAGEMLRSEPLDFVDVAVGPEAHEQLVLLAARHHKAVICQKPMAFELAACERMVAACRDAGIPFLIHENFRWQTPMRRVKALLDSSIIGRPFRAHIQFSHGDIALFESQPYLFTQPHFALYDMGPHLLDLPRFFFGEPQTLYAREFHLDLRFAGEDIVSVMLGYDRLTCHCELTWRTTDYEVFVEGESGTVKWGADGKLTISTEAGTTTDVLTPRYYAWSDPRYGFAHPSIVDTNADLLAALRGEAAAATTGDDNLKTMKLLFAALRSAATNTVVQL